MRQICTLKTVLTFSLVTVIAAGVAPEARATEWQATTGAESHNRDREALAFLPNELWIHAGDSVRWTFPTHERHTLTFLRPNQTRPPGFGPVFGVAVGCPGITPDGSSYDGSTCVTSDILLLGEDSKADATPLTYSVSFPTAGNFKFVCLLHADMTGVIHVVDPSQPVPFNQNVYNAEAASARSLLLADASGLRGSQDVDDHDRGRPNDVAVGIGAVVTTTGAGSQTAALMRMVPDTIYVRVGDTVEWTSLDPSINHTVTFGVEPADPRPPSSNVTSTSDGARQAIIASQSDSVNSGFLSPAPQDRANLAQAPPGTTRFRVTFTSPGTFNYICAVHDQLGMKGTVIVH